MKQLIILSISVIILLTACKKDDDPTPSNKTSNPVTQKYDTLKGLYSYMGMGNVYFTSDSIEYKKSGYSCSCTVDTTQTSFKNQLIWKSKGDFIAVSHTVIPENNIDVYSYTYNEFVSVNAKVYTYKEYEPTSDETTSYKNGNFNMVTYTKY